MKSIALVLCLAGMAPIVRAASLPTGTWVRRPNNDGISSTLTIEAAGTGRKLTFKVAFANGGTSTMTVTTQVDGKDSIVSVDGKPTGQTMAIRMIDDHHAVNITKINGNVMATQKSELSADGKVFKTETTPTAPGVPNIIEYWDKK